MGTPQKGQSLSKLKENLLESSTTIERNENQVEYMKSFMEVVANSMSL